MPSEHLGIWMHNKYHMLLSDFTPELKIMENRLPRMKRKVFLFTNHALSFCLRYFCCCIYLKTQLVKYYITHVIYINKKTWKSIFAISCETYRRKRQTCKVSFNLQTSNPCTPSFPPLIIHEAQCASQNVTLRRGGSFPAGMEPKAPHPGEPAVVGNPRVNTAARDGGN